MFNLQGSEIIFILLIALVVLGPEKLPGAVRRVTSLYAELRKMSNGFQQEFKSALDEPLREMKSTADLVKGAADPKKVAEEAEREAERTALAEKKAKQARDVTEAMDAAGKQEAVTTTDLAPPAAGVEPIDAFADPVEADTVDEAVGVSSQTGDAGVWAPPDAAAPVAGEDAPPEPALEPPVAGLSAAVLDAATEESSA